MPIEKVKQIAREKYGKELTNEQAAKYAEKYGKLTDDELDRVSGGYGFCDAEYHVGKVCETCGVECVAIYSDSSLNVAEWLIDCAERFKCPICGAVYS